MAKAVKKAGPKKKAAVATEAVKRPDLSAPRTGTLGFTAKAEKEITASYPDSIGLTARGAAAVAAENVNILAATGYSANGMRRNTTFNLIVDDVPKAERAIEKQHLHRFRISEPNPVHPFDKSFA